jgi:hypothetical protein
MADDFAAQCKAAARDLRRVPAELRKRLGREVRDEVAEPLAAEIRSSLDGPYRGVLVPAVKARIQGDPMIVVGGARPVLSGGASVRDVVFGDEFGGGSRLGTVRSTGRRRGHARHTTRQFKGKARHYILGTIESNAARTFDRWADVVERIIKGTVT